MVGAYHKRRVGPIMARALALDEMRPDAPVEAVARTVMAVGEISDAEVTQRLREAFDKPYPVFPVPGHPAMRPELGFARFDRYDFRLSSAPFARGCDPAGDKPYRRREEEEEERCQMGLESCSAGPPGGTRVAQKRGEQVDSDVESPEEPDWSADDGSNDDDDDHDREELIDWGVTAYSGGPIVDSPAGAGVGGVPLTGITTTGPPSASEVGRRASPSPTSSTAAAVLGAPQGLWPPPSVLGKRQGEPIEQARPSVGGAPEDREGAPASSPGRYVPGGYVVGAHRVVRDGDTRGASAHGLRYHRNRDDRRRRISRAERRGILRRFRPRGPAVADENGPSCRHVKRVTIRRSVTPGCRRHGVAPSERSHNRSEATAVGIGGDLRAPRREELVGRAAVRAGLPRRGLARNLEYESSSRRLQEVTSRVIVVHRSLDDANTQARADAEEAERLRGQLRSAAEARGAGTRRGQGRTRGHGPGTRRSGLRSRRRHQVCRGREARARRSTRGAPRQNSYLAPFVQVGVWSWGSDPCSSPLPLFAGARDEAAKLRQELAEAVDLQKKIEAALTAEAERLRTVIDSLNGTVKQLRGAEDQASFRAVHSAFSIARNYYDNIRFDLVSEGYPDGYTDEQLEQFDAEVEPFARALAEKLKL
ncbi:hypothetical protein PVAP13_9NG300773 [Panicum virgatum]|uniref:Uncharacterized protein n=1 Tax=Panicum virgatum TaxID=38727 RepID=A0A8T0ML48_PANVG|nr:hypothetical protein PVAP13_9NG300773 [Panicum virgatum]